MGATVPKSTTLLLVEDSSDDAFLIQFALRRAKCEFLVRLVEDGEKAIAYLKGEAPFADRKENPFPDLVLLDLNLPKIDGFAVLDWIRAAPGCSELKVFVVSSWDYPNFPERAMKAGANLFLSKSQDWVTLGNAIAVNFSAPSSDQTEPGNQPGGVS